MKIDGQFAIFDDGSFVDLQEIASGRIVVKSRISGVSTTYEYCMVLIFRGGGTYEISRWHEKGKKEIEAMIETILEEMKKRKAFSLG